MMFSNPVSSIHYSHLLMIFGILFTTEGQLDRTTTRQSLVTLNPCKYYNPRYSYAIINCVWRDLPSNMLERYNTRFKELVQLDDDGVFKLLCQSTDQRGDLILEAFANEYTKENEKLLFLNVVGACHTEVMNELHQVGSD
ncbi:uncharacterized protein LOC111265899 [Varroa jacobsoni]|uniref:uncharacterized protein LOC111265899 n=1 Tax=Varroa jacobsoni TaxID=62625 RepID=UPI000BF4BC4B|nr:uncharacterized protein LOC111265899 [Varroa jacobsoni]XP_022698632.1 uncharacterized protein LOC111265899 [Varroa jacobsoni]